MDCCLEGLGLVIPGQKAPPLKNEVPERGELPHLKPTFLKRQIISNDQYDFGRELYA